MAARVRQLIDGAHGGSVNAAAQDIGIPQRTLANVATGKVESPRSNVLLRVAEFYRVSVDWLLTGEGPGPERWIGYAAALESIRWADLVIALKLPEPAHSALLYLPDATGQAAMLFRLPRLGGRPRQELPGHPGVFQKAGIAPEFITASQLEHRAWLAFFQGWIQQAGREAVREAVLANAEAVGKRFVAPREYGIPEP